MIAKKMEMLIVEDEPALRRLYTIILSSLFEITVCESAEEAINLIKQPGFVTDVILTDYDCPDTASGGHVTRTANLCLPGVIIILMTGGGYTEEDLRQKHKFNDFLHKPFETKTILEVAKKYSTAKYSQAH